MGVISRFLWTVAILCGLVTLAISVSAGRTPLTEALFAAALVCGVAGILVDRARAGAR